MPVEDAIKAYAKLSKDIFSHKKRFGDGKYSAKRLEAAVKEIVKERAGDTGYGILDSRTRDEICRTYALSLNLMSVCCSRYCL